MSNISKSCYYHICSLRHIRPSMTEDVFNIIVCSMFGCRLDYTNSVFIGASISFLHKLERIQNTLAQVVTREHDRSSISAILYKKHWLPMKWKIDIEVATLTYKVLQSGEPSYLSSRIAIAIPRRSLHSSSETQRLEVLPHKLKIGSRAFKLVVPTIWNCPPLGVRTLGANL